MYSRKDPKNGKKRDRFLLHWIFCFFPRSHFLQKEISPFTATYPASVSLAPCLAAKWTRPARS